MEPPLHWVFFPQNSRARRLAWLIGTRKALAPSARGGGVEMVCSTRVLGGAPHGLERRANLTVAFRGSVGPGTASERRHLEEMLADLPPRSLLVADAGFTGSDVEPNARSGVVRIDVGVVGPVAAGPHDGVGRGGAGRRPAGLVGGQGARPGAVKHAAGVAAWASGRGFGQGFEYSGERPIRLTRR